MLVAGPQTLTTGVENDIVDPAETGNPSIAVQIQNSSPYQLSILAAGDGYSIQPFFAQTIPIAGGVPIAITPLRQVGLTAACSVTLTFLLGTSSGDGVQLPGGQWVEAPPQQDGPLTAAAIASALTSQGSVDDLGTWGLNSVFNITAEHSYTAMMANFFLNVGDSVLCFQVNNVSKNLNFVVPVGVPPGTAGGPYQALAAIACSVGDTIQIVAYGTFTPGSFGEASGMTNGPVPPVRHDGRGHPLGRFNASALAPGAGAFTLVGAPGSSFRIFIKSLHVSSTTAFMDINGTLNGAGVEIIGVPTSQVAVLEKESGLLMDANTALTYNSGAANGRATVYFDYVI